MIDLQRLPKNTLLFTLILLFIPGIALAGDSSSADNCFAMISAAMVMLMTLGVAIFYDVWMVCFNAGSLKEVAD
ncbi:MAG: hypothetical protein WC364_05960 [Eubacteriales bacterium]